MKFAVILFLLLAIAGSRAFAAKGKILMIIAPKDFRDEELLVPKSEFEKAGYEVVVASKVRDKCVGMLGAEVVPDITIAEVNIDDYVAVVLVGGSGSTVYFEDEEVRSLVQKAYDSGKITSAICLAPVILANAGLLDGKEATVWKGASQQIQEKGARYTGAPVSEDGNLITGSGPSAARDFAMQVLSQIERKTNE